VITVSSFVFFYMVYFNIFFVSFILFISIVTNTVWLGVHGEEWAEHLFVSLVEEDMMKSAWNGLSSSCHCASRWKPSVVLVIKRPANGRPPDVKASTLPKFDTEF